MPETVYIIFYEDDEYGHWNIRGVFLTKDVLDSFVDKHNKDCLEFGNEYNFIREYENHSMGFFWKEIPVNVMI